MKRLLIGVLGFACGEVRVEPADGGGGAGPSLPPGGDGGGPISMGSYAVGGNGGGEPGPVPGCETLIWAGEPFSIPGFSIGEVVLARLANGAVGVVYVEATQGLPDDRLTSRVIEGAFDSWPPTTIGEPVVHKESDLVFGSASITARDDGTFALVDYEPGIYRFGVPGMLLGSYPPYTYPFVEPDGDGAYFIERPLEGLLRFYKRASIEPLAPEEDLGELPLPDFCSTAYSELNGVPTFLFASRSYCYGEDDAPFAQFYQLQSTGVQVASTLLLPFFPREQALARRPAGFWYAISGEQETYVYRLTPTTATIGEPFVFEGNGINARSFSPWRDGFVLSERTSDGVTLFVSNGELITAAPAGEPNPVPNMEATRMLVGGENDASILIAVPLWDRVAIWRADCASG